jgi:hypothetical protein
MAMRQAELGMRFAFSAVFVLISPEILPAKYRPTRQN